MTRLDSYLETILWSETLLLSEDDIDEDGICTVEGPFEGATEGEPLDNFVGCEDFSEEARAKAESDLDNFFDSLEIQGLLDDAREYADDDHIAHDFWLTRNGHGAGFWDGNYGGELGDSLTEVAKAYGSQYAYTDADGTVHLS